MINPKYRCTGNKRFSIEQDEFRHHLPQNYQTIRCECGEWLNKAYLKSHVCHKVHGAIKRLESGLKRSKASNETIELFLAEHYPEHG